MVNAQSGGVVPPKVGDKVRMVCRSCGRGFYARNWGAALVLFGAKCPECKSRDTERDFTVVN